ncbi:MAG: Glycerol kinase [Chlamydiia bacterium]|nr:Glycerol kinase [Chlamydiia bacterium]
MKYILSIDIGNTNIKAVVVNDQGELLNIHEQLIKAYNPRHGQVEFRPEEIFDQVLFVIDRVLAKSNIVKSDLLSIGITNAKGATVLWNKQTQKPIWNGISASDDRGYRRLKEFSTYQDLIKHKTGHYINTHSPALKIKWVLDHAKVSKKEEILFGSLGTWILWKLTKGKIHLMDMTNAAGSSLLNIQTGEWDDDLLKLFDIPKSILPETRSCCEVYGHTDLEVFGNKIPIGSMITKTQSAIFGSGCGSKGNIHCHLGSGTHLSAPTGEILLNNHHTLTTTIALSIKDQPLNYCLEGSIHSTGGVIDWLKNHLGLIRSVKEIEGLAYSVPDSLGVYFIPALNGLCFSKDKHVMRGSFLGLSCNTNIGHMCRASLEGIALLLAELHDLMKEDLKQIPHSMKCSGGMSENTFLMQIMADALDTILIRPKHIEMAALGSAYLAGIATDVWSEKDIPTFFKREKDFTPTLPKKDREAMRRDFKRALEATTFFSKI